MRLASGDLSADDRFLSLVEYFARAEDAVLRRDSNVKLQCRLYSVDGNEITTLLHTRGSSYLDDDRRGSGMRRRLKWLGFRRRFLLRVIPGILLWTVAYLLVIGVIGLPIDVALVVSLGALLLQNAVILFLARKV